MEPEFDEIPPAASLRGRTLAAIMVAIGAVAIGLYVGLPRGPSSPTSEADSLVGRLAAARASANELAAIAGMRNMISAQAQFQRTAKADVDRDGVGEYGGFIEMSGAGTGRMLRALEPPVLSSAYRRLDASGAVHRSGYWFRIYLPEAAGRGVGEPATGFVASHVDADLGELHWCAYAWPATYGESGRRTFFTNETGDLRASENRAYSGSSAGPASDAAFRTADAGRITGDVAVVDAAVDGGHWEPVR